MEKTYKFLKILIALLLAAVIAAGLWRVVGRKETEVPVPESAQTQATAPDFTVYDADGNAHKLSDFRGKPVVLNFWASWCGPCQAEMPDFEQAWKTHGENVQFLIVNLTDGGSETVESASEFIAQKGYTFPVYFDTELSGAAAYNITGIPASFFIDADGVLVTSKVGMMNGEALEEAISRILN